jgi:hypothetical protein
MHFGHDCNVINPAILPEEYKISDLSIFGQSGSADPYLLSG